MCIFVIVLASVICVACLFANKKLRKRIKELEAEFQSAERYVAALDEAAGRGIKAMEDKIAELEAELAKTPARGADGRYISRRK